MSANFNVRRCFIQYIKLRFASKKQTPHHGLSIDFKFCSDVVVRKTKGFELLDFGGEDLVEGLCLMAGDLEPEGELGKGSNSLRLGPIPNPVQSPVVFYPDYIYQLF